MCGIVGYIGNNNAISIVLKGLKRLEYRGYDSAGIAYLHPEGLSVKKKSRKVKKCLLILLLHKPLGQEDLDPR